MAEFTEAFGDAAVEMTFREIGTPCLDGLHLDWYLDTADADNPMQRLWSNGRWNKLMMAHGCYWAKCTFCDTTLDYIGRFDSAPATEIADRMDGLVAQSGESGFHFTDEAMPPAIVRQLSEELLARKRTYSWWGNIRFESFYSSEICYLMHQAGCIAVSGGIEVASDRVLKRINKGVSIDSLKQTLRPLPLPLLILNPNQTKYRKKHRFYPIKIHSHQL